MKSIKLWFETVDEQSIKIQTYFQDENLEKFVSALGILQDILHDEMDIIGQISMNPSEE